MFATDLKYLATIKIPEYTGAFVHGSVRVGISRREDRQVVKEAVSTYTNQHPTSSRGLLYKAACSPFLLDDDVSHANFYVEIGLLVSPLVWVGTRSKSWSCNLSLQGESNFITDALARGVPLTRDALLAQMTDIYIRDMGTERLIQIGNFYLEYILGQAHNPSSHFQAYRP
jgi:hypothetical protein